MRKIPWINHQSVLKEISLLRPHQSKVGLKEAGLGLVSTAGTRIGRPPRGKEKPKIPEDPRKAFDKYITAYMGVPLVAAAIDRTVDFVVSPGFYIDSESNRVKNKITDFIEDMDFDIFLRTVVKDMLIFGDSFVEVIGKEKSVEELKVLNPVYMRVERDITGEVTGYFQDLRGATKHKDNPWKPEQIAHFIHNKIADSPYGTSILEPLETILDIKVSMEKSMKRIMEKHAGAPLHIKIGDTKLGYPANQTDIDSMTSDVQALTNETNWVTTDMCDINGVDVGKKVIDMEPYTEHVDNQMVYGLQVPFVLLGKARIPEGLASVQLEAMDRKAKSIQILVSQQIENKIFPRLTASSGVKNKKAKLMWGEPSKVTETTELSTYLEMMKVDMSPEFKQELENKIRKILNIKGDAPKYPENEPEGPFQNYVKKSKKGVMGDEDRRKEINLPRQKKGS